MANLSTVFLGTPDFAVPTLQALMAAPDFDVIAVYTQPPRQAGRGKRLRPSAVHQAAENHDIPVYTPVSLKGGEVQGEFSDLGADVAVVVAYGLILPKPILTAPRLGCFNLHGSLLPRWRGAAPIQRAIMAGDDVTGVCIMLMDEGLDTGDIIYQKTFEKPQHKFLDEIYDPYIRSETLVDIVSQNLLNKQNFKKQNIHDGETYFIIHPVLKHIAVINCIN